MARTAIPTYTTNQLITAAHGNTYWKDNEATHWSEINADCVMATRSAAQSIPNSTTTEILWDTEAYDHGGLHSVASNTGRLIAVKAGIYAYTLNLEFDTGTTGYRQIEIQRNGPGGNALIMINLDADFSIQFSMSGEIDLAVGGYINAYALHTQGAALNIIRNDDHFPNFCMHYIRSN